MLKGFFNRHFNRPTYIRDQHYKDHYSELYERLNSLKSLGENNGEKFQEIDSEIEFNKVSFGCSKKELQNKLGKPDFLFKNKKVDTHQILLYIKGRGLEKVKTEFHFIGQELFLVKYIIKYNKSKAAFKAKESILKQFKLSTNKYFEYKVQDKSYNKLIIRNDLQFEANYLWGADHIRQILFDKSSRLIRVDMTEPSVDLLYGSR